MQIFIACHGPLAQALKESAELIIGTRATLTAAPPFTGDVEELDRALEAALEAVDAGDRLLVLTDLLGGSVNTHLALAAARDPRLILVTGTNLGLLIELAASGVDDLEGTLERAREGMTAVTIDAAAEEDF